jgi:hypothetical protein
MSNKELVHCAEMAEINDIPAWVAFFKPDGVSVDESVGMTLDLSRRVGERAPAMV